MRAPDTRILFFSRAFIFSFIASFQLRTNKSSFTLEGLEIIDNAPNSDSKEKIQHDKKNCWIRCFVQECLPFHKAIGKSKSSITGELTGESIVGTLTASLILSRRSTCLFSCSAYSLYRWYASFKSEAIHLAGHHVNVLYSSKIRTTILFWLLL